MNQVGFGALLPLLLVLTSGWGLLQSHYGKSFVWWQSGYNLYFRIALAGILCFLVSIASAITVAVLGFLPGFPCTDADGAFISLLLRCQNEILSHAALATPVFGLSGYALANIFWKAEHPTIEEKREEIIRGRELEGYIKRTMEKHPFLLITLDNRKAYISIASSTFHFNELDREEQYLRLRVMFSGYRGDADLQFRITAEYVTREEEKSQDANLEGAEIIVPVRKIASIQPFDREVHFKFHDGK